MNPASKNHGLSAQEAEARLKRYGLNRLPQKETDSDLKIFFDQLKSPLIYVLLIALLVTVFLKEFSDSFIIGLAVVVNTFLGFYQERQASRALQALASLVYPQATILRDNQERRLSSELLVPGDVVIVNPGDRIAADGRILTANHLFVNEAILTGESMPVSKKKSSQAQGEVYLGAGVISGNARFLVVKTGLKTRLGQIALKLSQTSQEKTPLQKKLSRLARQLALLVGVLSFLVFSLGLLFGQNPADMFTTSIAIAVAAIPEGLVVALTAILSIGMQRILKRKGLVRKLVAAETLGSVDLICTDKTGTLTQGQMKVSSHKLIDSGQAALAAFLANSRSDPLEIALFQWVREEPAFTLADGVDEKSLGWRKLDELPFLANKRFQGVLVENIKKPNGPRTIFITGAPEILVGNSTLSQKDKIKWLKLIEEWASRGLRLVAAASKKVSSGRSRLKEEDLNLISFLGLWALSDPVRPTVAPAFKAAQKAGIEIKVVTGDYQSTALAVMKKLNLKIENQEIEAITGAEFNQLSDQALDQKIERIKLFARMTPEQKLRLVERLKAKNRVVAIFGDGVNDALALKKADIGVVVGSASEVAQETADLILMDNNFQTALAAIEEGRGIFDNLRKVVLYLLSDAFTEMILIVGALLTRLPVPLTAAQILWINLVSDGFPNLALALDPKDPDLMKRKPVPLQAPIIDLEMKSLIGLISLATGFVSLGLYWFFLNQTNDLALARTVAMITVSIDSLFYVFSVSALSQSILAINPLRNPWLAPAVLAGLVLTAAAVYLPLFQDLLGTVALGPLEWGVALSAAFLVIILIEGVKIIFNLAKKV